MVHTLNEHPVAQSHVQSERQYWSSLLNGRMMPGLGLAASRFKVAPPTTTTLAKVTGRLDLPADDSSAIAPTR